MLVHERDGHGTLADGCGHSLDGTVADIAHRYISTKLSGPFFATSSPNGFVPIPMCTGFVSVATSPPPARSRTRWSSASRMVARSSKLSSSKFSSLPGRGLLEMTHSHSASPSAKSVRSVTVSTWTSCSPASASTARKRSGSASWNSGGGGSDGGPSKCGRTV